MCRRPAQLPARLLAAAFILSSVVLRLDARFLKSTKQPPGTTGIVSYDEDGDGVYFGTVSSDSQETDREKANEMISVKLLNQFHTRLFETSRDQLDESEPGRTDERTVPTAPDYETVNQLDADGATTEEPHVRPLPDEPDVIDVQENVIEDDFPPIEPMVEKLRPNELQMPGELSVVSAHANRSTSTTLTTTTTRTMTSTTTVRKVRRKLRQQLIVTSSSIPTSTTTQRSRPTTSTPVTSTTVGRRPPGPRIDITRLNLEHLENELVSFHDLIHPQALTGGPGSSSARLLPRSIRPVATVQPPPEETPSCGCQHRKRSLAKDQYLSEENGDYDDYDYDYNDVRRSAPPYGKLPDRPMLFPAMSRLLNPAAVEPLESSVERAEKVHGTLERLMGIVTIFSHVDEFIQRKTKQSIRRLARLYESEEAY